MTRPTGLKGEVLLSALGEVVKERREHPFAVIVNVDGHHVGPDDDPEASTLQSLFEAAGAPPLVLGVDLNDGSPRGSQQMTPLGGRLRERGHASLIGIDVDG